jgi:hypothetical protein
MSGLFFSYSMAQEKPAVFRKVTFLAIKTLNISTFADVIIIICTDNQPLEQQFLSKFENRPTLIYLFWLIEPISKYQFYVLWFNPP